MKQQEEFEALYNMFYEYVFEYHVGYKGDFDKDRPKYYYDRESFAEMLDDVAMEIKVREGY